MNKIKKMFKDGNKIEKIFMVIVPLILILGMLELTNTETFESEQAYLEIEENQVEEVKKAEEAKKIDESKKIEEEKRKSEEAKKIEGAEISQLFTDVFEVFISKIGQSTFSDDEIVVNSLGYNFELTTPSDEDLAIIKVNDGSGDYVSLMYFPKNNVEVLTLVTYNRNGHEISVKNNLHDSKTLIYNTYDIKREPKNESASGIAELKKFMFIEVGDGASTASEKIEMYINETYFIDSDGKLHFEIDTNLPNESKLMVSLRGGDYSASSKVVVKDGKATTEKFSNKGNSLPSGEYNVTITMSVPSTQENFVIDIIGNTGENMIGDLVEESVTGGGNVLRKEVIISI